MPSTQPDIFEVFFKDSADSLEIAEELISSLELIITNLSISQFEHSNANSDSSLKSSA